MKVSGMAPDIRSDASRMQKRDATTDLHELATDLHEHMGDTVCADSITTDSIAKFRRPRVGLVLGGGGAKGAAHIGALKVIEEAGIPIDLIVGTSMGSIVGGFYSAGYTTHYLDSIFRVQNWMPLLTDGSLYRYKSYLNKERSGSYILSLPLDSLSKVKRVSRAGIIEGKNILSLFDRHLQAYPDSMPSFSALPTNFACVAADIVNGREVVLDHGNLSRSIRSSMSIPGVFEPVRIDTLVLVDGGLLNNFPVDVARRMGADIVIGINLGDGLKAHSDITSTSGMLDQLISMSAQAKLDRNIPDTDIYVRVNTQGYSAGSFSTAAIDTLLRRGEESTRQQQQEALDSLGRWLGGNKEFLARQQHLTDSLVQVMPPDPMTTFQDLGFPNDELGFSANFNLEELASLFLQAYHIVPIWHIPTQFGVSLRLGKRTHVKADMLARLLPVLYANISYKGSHNNIMFKHNADDALQLKYNEHDVHLGFIHPWKKGEISYGIRQSFYQNESALINENSPANDFANRLRQDEQTTDLYLQTGINTTDDKHFPTRGIKLITEGNLFLGSNIACNGRDQVWAIQSSATVYIPLNRHWVLAPSYHVRDLSNNSQVLGIFNTFGGIWESNYTSHQIPLIGMGDLEWAKRSILTGGLSARYSPRADHYAALHLNIAGEGDGLKQAFSDRPIISTALSYSYNSFIGPLSAFLTYSNRANWNIYISIGHNF